MTVIVGPNGSGKSNISDAVKWVLGELSAKNIRGVKLEDVIFGGTDRRSPMGFAEVSLTIDNTGEFRIRSDYNEITVTRRYYRTGESEYLVNGKPGRLKDIVDLFMNTGVGKTGYSVIGQGKISEIIAQRPEDRRYIFEEAAGISKYRYKKQEAERKLAETEANLVRLNDIVSVLEGRVGPLERDAAKARTYLELYGRKKELDVSLALYDIDNIASQTEEFERSYVMARHSLEMADDSLSALDKQSASLYSKIEENKQKTDETRALLSVKTEERHEAHTRRLLAEKEIEHGESELARYAAENEKLKERLLSADRRAQEQKVLLDDAEKKLALLRDDYTNAEEELEAARTAAADLDKEIAQAEEEKSACEKKLIDDRIRLSALESSRSSLSERMQGVSGELAAAEEALAEAEKKLSDSTALLGSYRGEAAATQAEKKTLLEQCEALEREIALLTEEKNKTQVLMTAKAEQASTLRRMEEHFDGYQKSVRFVLDAAARGRLSGICGPVSKLIRVEARYSVAIETALGSSIQNIVTEDEEAAKAAIAALKRENAGRATFYPLSSVRADRAKVDREKAEKCRGYVGIASELIDCEPRYREVIRSMLGRTFVFDNLDNAADMARRFGYTVRIVTLDGQQINAGGSYTGGSAKRDSGILSRSREIASLTGEAEALKKTAEKAEDAIRKKEEALGLQREKLDELNDGYMLLAAMYKAEETSHAMLAEQCTARKEAVETLRRSAEHIRHQDTAGAEQKEILAREAEDLSQSIRQLEKRLSSLHSEAGEAEKKIAADGDGQNRRLLAITVADKEAEAARLAYDRCLEEIAAAREEQETISQASQDKEESFGRLNETVVAMRARAEELDRILSETEAALGALQKTAAELDALSQELRDRVKSKTEERNLYFEQFTKLENRRAGLLGEKDKLTERLWEDYELTYAAASELGYPAVTEKTRSKCVGEQTKLRSKIRELGPVNVGAIEEYNEVKEEYDRMSGQIEDLTKSRKDYTDIVTQLEKEMCRQFQDSFHEINKNFMVVFRELFGGGSAKLELTDPEHVLTSGIEIIVSPPGKVIKNLKSLSGGEQVFVAIAILFAIFKINPPPFCLLDEIESALDEVNVSRFANYAKNFCDHTQIIAISHRRGTMEAANALYGVTMQERGVSKLLSINVSEVEKKIGIKFGA